MDYTDLTTVKEALGATESANDMLLARVITAASRMIDRYCAGTRATDYFAGAVVADEIGSGVVARDGQLYVFPLKPIVGQVLSLSYRHGAGQPWNEVDTSDVIINDYQVIVGLSEAIPRGVVHTKVSYTGGYGATVADLPPDLVEAATVLAVRLYREVKSGLTDTIGVAELGTLAYTKAWPVRVTEMLQPWKRVRG